MIGIFENHMIAICRSSKVHKQCLVSRAKSKTSPSLGSLVNGYTAPLRGLGVIFTESRGTPMSAASFAKASITSDGKPCLLSVLCLSWNIFGISVHCVLYLLPVWLLRSTLEVLEYTNQPRQKQNPPLSSFSATRVTVCTQYLVPGERFLSTDGNSEIRYLLLFLFTDPVAEKI